MEGGQFKTFHLTVHHNPLIAYRITSNSDSFLK